LPAAISAPCAETILEEKKIEKQRKSTVSLPAKGLQGIIDTIDSKKCG
jgi:hypothetical protein